MALNLLQVPSSTSIMDVTFFPSTPGIKVSRTVILPGTAGDWHKWDSVTFSQGALNCSADKSSLVDRDRLPSGTTTTTNTTTTPTTTTPSTTTTLTQGRGFHMARPTFMMLCLFHSGARPAIMKELCFFGLFIEKIPSLYTAQILPTGALMT